jgi:hypothetical protein
MENELEASGEDAGRESQRANARPAGPDRTRNLKSKNRNPKSAARASVGTDLSDEPTEEQPGTKARPATAIEHEPATTDAIRTNVTTGGGSVVQSQEAELIDIKVEFLVKLALEILDGD